MLLAMMLPPPVQRDPVTVGDTEKTPAQKDMYVPGAGSIPVSGELTKRVVGLEKRDGHLFARFGEAGHLAAHEVVKPTVMDKPHKGDVSLSAKMEGESLFDIDAGRWTERTTSHTLQMSGIESGHALKIASKTQTRWRLLSAGP
jgi:hypothetical protein